MQFSPHSPSLLAFYKFCLTALHSSELSHQLTLVLLMVWGQSWRHRPGGMPQDRDGRTEVLQMFCGDDHWEPSGNLM